MKILKRIRKTKIQNYLKNEGNSSDNLTKISPYQIFYVIELTANDFFNLCFIEIEITKVLTTNGRKLKKVAEKGLKLIEAGQVQLGKNWNVKQALEQTEKIMCKEETNMPPILLRDTFHPGCRYYIQDGNHRSLGMAMFLLKNPKRKFLPIKAFLATMAEI